MNHSFYMQRCLQLAAMAGGNTLSNPQVGAVIVCDGKIIGEGFHERYGKAHAETNAIASVKNTEMLLHSTLYVNLEPCSHYGKTPPCAELIVERRIPQVVVGIADPNPKVSGRGIEILQNAGIEVITGVLEKECRELNKRFFTAFEKNRPYITLKWAETADGFLDYARTGVDEKPLQISNALTQKLTHKIRSCNQAIMVGTNTVLLDNPQLTLRYWSGKNPVRVIIDKNGKIPADFQIFNNRAETIIFTEADKISSENITYIKVAFNENILQTIVKILCDRNINSLLVEGGAKLLNSFIAENLWDEIVVERSEQRIASGVKAPILRRLPDEVKIFEGRKIFLIMNYKL